MWDVHRFDVEACRINVCIGTDTILPPMHESNQALESDHPNNKACWCSRPLAESSGHPTDILVSEMFGKRQIDEAFFMQLVAVILGGESDGVET